MSSSQFIVLDSESDGLAYEATKIHIMSWTLDGKEVNHTDDYDVMREVLTLSDTLDVCHNAIRHDMPLFHRLLGIPMDYRKWVDTLALSWFLEPDRPSHGLDSFTKEVGVKKPKVDDWHNVTWEQMKERCGNDCLINYYVWEKQRKRLEEIYGSV